MTSPSETSPASSRQPGLVTWRVALQLIKLNPGIYTLHLVFGILPWLLQVVPGLIQKSIFDTITGAQAVQINLWLLIAVYLGVEATRLLLSFGASWFAWTFELGAATVV